MSAKGSKAAGGPKAAIGQKRPLATVGLGAGARTNRLSTYPAGRNWAADSFDWTIPIEGSVG